MVTIFCKCGNLKAQSSNYCLRCKADYMRDWREKKKNSGGLNESSRLRREWYAMEKELREKGLIGHPKS